MTAAGLTLLDDAGLRIDELELTEGSAAFQRTLVDHFGDPSEVFEDNECHAPGTMVSRWDRAGVTLTVSPPDDGDANPFRISFGLPDMPSGVTVRIPDGPAIGEDASASYAGVPAGQQGGQGNCFGTMVYDLSPGVAPDAGYHRLRAAVGYVHHEQVLDILTAPGGHGSLCC